MIFEVDTHENLAEFLLRTGKGNLPLCTLRKGCGKCHVKLLSGFWECNGKVVTAPAVLPPCCLKLKSTVGTVEIPEILPASPKIHLDWENLPPLPCRDEPVIAVDVGSTTLAGVRIEKGEIVKRAGLLNGQTAFGDNIISRIEKAQKDFSSLRRVLLDSLEELLLELDYKSVRCIGVAGNTVMSCFLHGISPASLGVYPFKAPQLIFPERNDLWGKAQVVTLPCLSGLLGGDIAAGLFTAGLQEGEMLLDLGTNCEMLLKSSAGLFGTSAAAGPAFEGSGITSGTRAHEGAVDRYFGKGRFSVIGGAKPQGVCGSALIDFLAVERNSGALNAFGRFVSGGSAFEIAPGVMIYEKDIAELLKAKAAVRSAVTALENFSGTKVRKLKVAGGFSRSLNLNSARCCGLLPDVETVVYGNLSLAGAAWGALKADTLPLMAAAAEELTVLHLNDYPGYEELFTKELLLP